MTPSIRDATRTWARSPVVAFVAALSLTLGIAAATTLYSVVDHLVLRRLPVPEPDALVTFGTEAEPLGRVSFPLWQQIQARREVFDSAFAASTTTFNVAPQGEVEQAQVALVSGGVFRTLQVSPAFGRLFDERDDARDGGPDGLVAVVTHHYWQRRFGGAPDTIGRTLVVEGTPFTIVGVTPRAFRGLRVGTAIDILLPLAAEPRVREFSFIDNGRVGFLGVLMRLAPGTSASSLTAALRAQQPAMREATLGFLRRPEDREAYLRSPIQVSPAADGGAGLSDYYRAAVTILFALAMLVLLACCGNVATVLVAHAAARRHALEIRAALGASRWDGPRQMLTDGLVLSVPAAAAALLLAHWAGPWILAQWHEARLDEAVAPASNWRVWGFASAMGMSSGLLSALAAAWRSTRHQALDALRGHGRASPASDRLQHVMVTGQLAFSVVVAVASALLLSSYDRVTSAPVLRALEHVVAIELRLSRSNVAPPARQATLDDVHRRVAAALPGVRLSQAMSVPFRGNVYLWAIASDTARATPATDRMALVDSVSDGHFAVLGTPTLAGRTFDGRDTSGAPLVGVANRSFARRFLGDETRLPQRVQADTGRGDRDIEIVGVVEDVPYENVVDPPEPVLYLSRRQLVPDDGRAYLLMAAAPGQGIPLATIRTAITTVSAGLSYEIVPLSAWARQQYARERMLAIVAVAYVVIAVVIAGLGVFGVMSHAVASRRRDFGIRLALGARPRQVAAMVVGRAARVTFLGTMLGLAASWYAARLVGRLLVTPDVLTPFVFAEAGAVMAVIGILAAWWPARDAARLEPSLVLRTE